MENIVDRKARRAAMREGLRAERSRQFARSKHPRKNDGTFVPTGGGAVDVGGFRIVDPVTHAVVSGEKFEMSAEDVITFCALPIEQRPAAAQLAAARPRRARRRAAELRHTTSPWTEDAAGCRTRTITAEAVQPEAGTIMTTPAPSPPPAARPAGKKLTNGAKPNGAAHATTAVGDREKHEGSRAQLKGRDASGGRKRIPPEDKAPKLADLGAPKVFAVRLTHDQVAAVDKWRARFAGLDLAASFRVLIDMGLTTRPREVVDPLVLAAATHRRRPGKGRPKSSRNQVVQLENARAQ